MVSTHSRPKAAGFKNGQDFNLKLVSTHSRPKAAGGKAYDSTTVYVVSTHSRPKAAGKVRRYPPPWVESFNTQPPEGGWLE